MSVTDSGETIILGPDEPKSETVVVPEDRRCELSCVDLEVRLVGACLSDISGDVIVAGVVLLGLP